MPPPVIQRASLRFAPPPPFRLDSRNPGEILPLLACQGSSYLPASPAAKLGVEAFTTGRSLAMTLYQRVSPDVSVYLDLDHTLTNFRIYKALLPLVWALNSGRYPFDEVDFPVRVVETARLFVQDLCLGMTVGFALCQGLEFFAEWKNYQPQVGVATLSTQVRLGRVIRHFPIFSIMAGRFPGDPEDETELPKNSPVFVHADDFFGYAKGLLEKFRDKGFPGLTPQERDEVMNYIWEGGADNSNPLGAMRKKKKEGPIVLIDDSRSIYDALRVDSVKGQVLPVHLGPPKQMIPGRDVSYFDYFSFSRWLAIRALRRGESVSPVPALLRKFQAYERQLNAGGQVKEPLGRFPEPHDPLRWEPPDYEVVPPGTHFHRVEDELPLRELHDESTAPRLEIQALVRDIIDRYGDIEEVERAYGRARREASGVEK